MSELTVGDEIASRRTARMPCLCDARDDGCELLSREVRGDSVRERVRCPCGETFKRIWIGEG